ncbi:hypothetical protein JGH11_04770 [Dysgonomonas sp. Marseille-P4677]|uniref:hypothetical protein n=1 Tax=Dysgonomonas sp. Marseille-P4677 TaxID=2364790 RepID=UPI001912B3E8|nr:hypothetical protein [Dysgonomonas sp. Marseille-P4677]MBK5720179.1 hypothetical protein [Dysgonomonas sp. Marseille-P4677]
MKYILILFITSLIAFSSSCKKGEAKYEMSDSIKKELNLINFTPDSLLSVELRDKKLNLLKIINDCIIVKNNQIITTATPETFRDVNLSEEYYNLLLKNIDEFNNYTKENNIENVDKMIDKAKNEMFR